MQDGDCPHLPIRGDLRLPVTGELLPIVISNFDIDYYYLLNYALNLHKYSIIYTYIQHIYIYPVFPFNGLVGWKKCFKLMMTNARLIRPGVVLYSLNTSRVTFFDFFVTNQVKMR